MNNPFAALIEDDIASTSQTSTPKLEEIFGFTLSKNRKKLVYLEEQAKTFPGKDLDLNNLEHTLFERLFLVEPKEFAQDPTGNPYYYEGKVINYLFSCYEKNSSRKNDEFKKSIQSLILRNVVTGLKQPDLFYGQDLFTQMFDILKDSTTLQEEFFKDTYNKFLEDDDGVDGMREPYSNLLKVIHMAVAKMTIISLNFSIFETLKFFTNYEYLADILIDYCRPKREGVGIEYANTLLGALFSISILPKTQNGSFEFFQHPLDQASNTATENLLYINIDKVTALIHTMLLNLLKSNASVRSKTLKWLGSCIKANADRGKLWNSQVPDVMLFPIVSDGFMLNMCSVLMRLCQPFCQPDNSNDFNVNKILKVDPTYCSVKNENCESKGIHLLDMSNETCLLPASSEEEQEANIQRLSAEKYSFVTECFYMGHRVLDLGYKVIADKLVKLNQEMARIERAYNDALTQGGGHSEIVDTMKQRMSTEMGRYLSIKAALSEPNLLEMVFTFVSASSLWFAQVAVHPVEPGKASYAPTVCKEINFPLNTKVPDTLKCIPEFIVENIVSFEVFLRRFNPKLFEERGYVQMKPMLTFILIFMGAPKFMKNPHLRARLAEGLEALLPFHKDDPPALNTLGGFQREKLFKEHEHRREIVVSLLEVFVAIEMTGQSVQFEQKFNYRRPMYAVMDYLWELPEHKDFFRSLAVEAEENMDAVTPPLFLRFINLLMNDAVYLLDEALANMSKLKEMHTARENGEWNVLSPQERAQNLGYIQHIGMVAKFDNILGRETIKTLVRLTSEITIVFTHATMVDRVAAMLNYFLLNLVGPNQKNFKVKNKKEYSFDPASTVIDICKIYINLKDSESFCSAVSQDGRSYSPQLFGLAQDVLVRIGGGGGVLVGELLDVAAKVCKLAEKHQANEDVLAEAPDHFLDPIMSTLMTDPVILPSSKQTVDRTTIARHLLSDQTDPFNRSPLTMDQVIPNKELRKEITQWLEEKKAGSN